MTTSSKSGEITRATGPLFERVVAAPIAADPKQFDADLSALRDQIYPTGGNDA